MWIAIILIWVTFTQGLVAFGLALVSMPFGVSPVGLSIAALLVATIGLFSPALIAWHYRQEIVRSEIAFAAIGSFIGIPLGVTALDVADEQLVKVLLGAVIIGYVVYSLIKPYLLFSSRAGWGVGLGFAGGIL